MASEISSNDKKMISQTAVMNDLARRGYQLYHPLNESTFIDLVIYRNFKLESVQVKYITPDKNGVMKLRLQRRTYDCLGSRCTYHYRETNLDWVAVYHPDTRIAYIPRRIWIKFGWDTNIHTNNNKNPRILYRFNDFIDLIDLRPLYEG